MPNPLSPDSSSWSSHNREPDNSLTLDRPCLFLNDNPSRIRGRGDNDAVKPIEPVLTRTRHFFRRLEHFRVRLQETFAFVRRRIHVDRLDRCMRGYRPFHVWRHNRPRRRLDVNDLGRR